MAKESVKARQRKREKLVQKYTKKRKYLKKNLIEAFKRSDVEEVLRIYSAFQKLPKNASPVRLHNRCSLTGRPKGYMRFYGISRIKFRELAAQGLIPGVTKSSW
ncbi:MAG: 30S ribosomal protein S14 [Flavobacteriales bacterium Tduv]